MENCPYCNEFMEIASDTPDCTHISNDPRGEWCCLNCNAHFDLDLQEVPIDEGIGKNPSTPTNPTDTPAQNPSTNPSDKDSSQESNKGDSSTSEKDNEQESSKEPNKDDSSTDSSEGESKENPSQPQPPQNLTLSSKAQITLAKQIYASLQGYKNYTKIHTDIIPILQDLQDYLAQDFDLIA